MKALKPASTLEIAAAALREAVRAIKEGTLLGSEEDLLARLKVSRATLRQAARLLEREGWLTVKRGINGGYFAARPNLRNIESTVGAYLEMVDADVEETTVIGSALWVEALKKAARLKSPEAREVARTLRDKVVALRHNSSFDDVLRTEMSMRNAIFNLINSRYIELIFQINIIFAKSHFPTRPGDFDNAVEHEAFVKAWRHAKLLEMAAIDDGDEDLAMLAARHSRNLWHDRLWHLRQTEQPELP
jgi:DNA-binding FadR family transcriptional regulator